MSTPVEDSPDPGSNEEQATCPSQILDLADGCVRFVERAVGARLTYDLETLPLLDHYTRLASETSPSAEASALVLRSVAAYLGEVVRRQFGGRWRGIEQEQLGEWEVFRSDLTLSVFPGVLASLAIDGEDHGAPILVVAPRHRPFVKAYLAAQPPLPEDEYNLPSNQLDAIEGVIDRLVALRPSELN